MTRSKKKIKQFIRKTKKPWLFYAPMEPYTASPINRELMIYNGADVVYRPKIQPRHLMKAINWQIFQKIPEKYREKYEKQKIILDGLQILPRPDDPLKKLISKINAEGYNWGIDFIDLNFGCPGHKVIQEGRGGALLQKPRKIINIINRFLKYSDYPITIKIRAGMTIDDSPKKLCKEISNEFRDNLTWIAINRAPVKMAYNITEELQKDIKPFEEAIDGLNSKIPLIVNGGIYNLSQAEEIVSKIEPYGLMIGTKALSHPQFFKELKQIFLETNKKNGNNVYGNKVYNGNNKNKKKNSRNNNLIKSYTTLYLKRDLDSFFTIASKYIGKNLGKWTTIGQLKLHLHPILKYWYLKDNSSLPAGFGKNSWQKRKFTYKEFPKILHEFWPKINLSQWETWLNPLFN